MVSPGQMPTDTQNIYYMPYAKYSTCLFHLILQHPYVLGVIIIPIFQSQRAEITFPR